MSGRESRFFYGWIVLAGLFIIMTTASGFAFYAQAVFLKALVDEQGFSSGMAGAGTGVYFAASGIGGYFTGALISRFDVRLVMTLGAAVAAIGIALLGQIRAPWQMVLIMALFGAGYSLVGLVPSTTMVTRWFHRQRNIALAIASTGLSVGGIAVTPVLAGLIDADSLVTWAPRFGIAFLLGLLPAIWFLVVPTPESIGERPDGDPPATDEIGGKPPAPAGTAFADAIRTRYFLLMSLGFILIMGAQVGAIQHTFGLTKDRVDIDTAKSTLMILSATSVVARITGGLIAMRVRLHVLTTALIGVQILGIALIGMGDSTPGITLGVVVLGSAMGNLLMLHPLLLTNAFGIRDYPRIYGLGSLLMITGVATGPALVGIINDRADYQSAFLVVAALGALGGLIYLSAGTPPVPDSTPPEDRRRGEGTDDDHIDQVGHIDDDGVEIDLDDAWSDRPPDEPSVFEVQPV